MNAWAATPVVFAFAASSELSIAAGRTLEAGEEVEGARAPWGRGAEAPRPSQRASACTASAWAANAVASGSLTHPAPVRSARNPPSAHCWSRR